MSVSKVYVYFNKSGSVVAKAPYIDTEVVRQGSDFELYVLFDKGTTNTDNVLSLMFKVPGVANHNLFPFLSYDSQYVLSESEKIVEGFSFTGPINFIPSEDISKLGIKKDIEYDCWKFSSASAYKDEDGNSKPLLTNVDGNLEVQLVLYVSEEDGSLTQTNYQGTFKVFVEKTLHYSSPFDVKQADLDRFIEEINEISISKARDVVVNLIPKKYVIDVVPQTNDNGRTEKLILTHREIVEDEETGIVSPQDSETEVEMPLPIATVTSESANEIEEQEVELTGTGKEDDPLNFHFKLHKSRDGYGIHAFVIDEKTGELIVYAERSDDLSEESYVINENGELVIKI
jgi:hypothetical protein